MAATVIQHIGLCQMNPVVGRDQPFDYQGSYINPYLHPIPDPPFPPDDLSLLFGALLGNEQSANEAAIIHHLRGDIDPRNYRPNRGGGPPGGGGGNPPGGGPPGGGNGHGHGGAGGGHGGAPGPPGPDGPYGGPGGGFGGPRRDTFGDIDMDGSDDDDDNPRPRRRRRVQVETPAQTTPLQPAQDPRTHTSTAAGFNMGPLPQQQAETQAPAAWANVHAQEHGMAAAHATAATAGASTTSGWTGGNTDVHEQQGRSEQSHDRHQENPQMGYQRGTTDPGAQVPTQAEPQMGMGGGAQQAAAAGVPSHAGMHGAGPSSPSIDHVAAALHAKERARKGKGRAVDASTVAGAAAQKPRVPRRDKHPFKGTRGDPQATTAAPENPRQVLTNPGPTKKKRSGGAYAAEQVRMARTHDAAVAKRTAEVPVNQRHIAKRSKATTSRRRGRDAATENYQDAVYAPSKKKARANSGPAELARGRFARRMA